ncbi:CD0415/CD1112 family protein [Lysinibacillus xylanilyticus]|uniref:VirB6/TrbL-like conjugal transfer protein, CD1112 family n=1 Tax=Lysinibacillus xylanilyticus TaxID=582475 RepID=UPI002E2318F3|nr:CD0415/CD1112 family protein [Lysinibacillus xylanilyticus]
MDEEVVDDGSWYDPIIDPIGSIIDSIKELLFDVFMTGTKFFLDQILKLFDKSVATIQTQVSETPTEFSQNLVDTMRTVSETAILPVAGLILTYIFCYELYHLVVEQNKSGNFETGQMLFLIIKTSAMILLLTNSFDITLAVFDVGKWITEQIPTETLKMPKDVTEAIVNGVPKNAVGEALALWVMATIALIIVFVMTGVIYLVAWSRMVTILLYISVAPLPFATFMNKDWIGSIGQTYVKNLLALMLQGYFMLICLLIYSGLLEKTANLIGDDSSLYGLLLMIVSMAILVVSLTRTHSLAKSVMGVV